ncbi:MAG: 30S ribosomal protein S7 [Verrucomicrobiia bacterium]
MARRRAATKREMTPDARYGNVLVSRLINTVMSRGKKSLAEKIVYGAIDSTNENAQAGGDPLEIFNKAIENVRPRVEVKARRVGGATYQVPTEVPYDRAVSLATRWIVTFAEKRKGSPMKRALAQEIKEAASGQGAAVKKKEDVHKMAQANKAFAHFRW